MESVKKSIDERAQHKREYDSRANERNMQSKEGKVDSSKSLDASLVVTECSGTKSDKQDTSISSVNYITHVVDADIRPVNDQVPFVEVDSNTTLDSTNMCHRGEVIDQNAEKCQVTSPLLDPLTQPNTSEQSIQSLEQHGQILNETSNKAKIKREIEVLETINIELEHIVAKLLAENEKLHKEIEHLKQTYKDLYDSIKKTRVQTKDHNDSLIAQINNKTVEC
ncbi:hypothetical protein Tco_1509317 [Tanacetum coccineum]